MIAISAQSAPSMWWATSVMPAEATTHAELDATNSEESSLVCRSRLVQHALWCFIRDQLMLQASARLDEIDCFTAGHVHWIRNDRRPQATAVQGLPPQWCIQCHSMTWFAHIAHYGTIICLVGSLLRPR